MKITDLSIDVIERTAPAVRVCDDRRDLGGRTRQGVLRISTDEDVAGVCLIGQQGADAMHQMETIVAKLKPVLLGMDPAHRERFWNGLDRISGHGMPLQPTAAPVDVALWDIAGKRAGQPILELLGTQRTETPVYATYPPRHDTPAGFAEEAEALKAQGFRAYKVHPGPLSVSDTIETVELIRAAVGAEFALMLDRNHGYSLQQALRVGRALDANDYYWFEDPVSANDFESIATLSRQLVTPLNMSDTATFLFRQAAHFLTLGAPRLIRGTVRKLGITGLKKLCAMVEGFGKNCEIGLAGNSALNMANLHVILSVPNCAYYEHWLPAELHQWGTVSQLRITPRGSLEAPTEPGLGIELDEDWIASHKVATLS